MAQPARAKQIISLHFSVDYAYLYILYTSHFKQLSLPFSVDNAYLYILYTSYFKQLLYSVDCKLWVSIFCVCNQVIAYDYSTTATEKCLWTHPFENRTKLSPFVSRGSNLYRAPQGKIECENCVTWVSWPSLLGQNRIYTNNVIWVALNLIVYDHSTTATEKCLWTHPFENPTKVSSFVSRGSNLYRAPQGKIECDNCITWVSWPSVWERIPSKTELSRVPLFREGPIYIEPRRAK